MRRKIVACFVMVIFFLVSVAPNVEAGGKKAHYSTAADWRGFENAMAPVAIGITILAITGVVWLISKAIKKAPADENQPTSSKDNTSSLPNVEKADNAVPSGCQKGEELKEKVEDKREEEAEEEAEEANNPPNTPSNPTPANEATGQSVDVNLGRTGGDPDAGDTVVYDVYFGTAASPPQVSNDQPATIALIQGP